MILNIEEDKMGKTIKKLILAFVLFASYSVIFGSTPTSITTTANPANATAYDFVTFTIDYANVGGAVINNYMIWDSIPLGFTFNEASANAAYAGSTVTWTLGTLNPGDTGTAYVVCQNMSGCLGGTNVWADAADSEGAASSISVSVPSCTFTPTITRTRTPTPLPTVIATDTPVNPTSITKTANPSNVTAMFGAQQVTYTIAYQNNTAADISGYSIWDTLPLGYVYNSSSAGGVNSLGVVTWNIGTLYAGVSGTVQVVAAPFLSFGPVMVNYANDSMGADSNAAVNQPSPTFSATVTLSTTQAATQTITQTVTQTTTQAATQTITQTVTQTTTQAATQASTQTITQTATLTITKTFTQTTTQAATLTITQTITQTMYFTSTSTVTPSFTPTIGMSGTFTFTQTQIPTATLTPTVTITWATAAVNVTVSHNPGTSWYINIDVNSSTPLASDPVVTVISPDGITQHTYTASLVQGTSIYQVKFLSDKGFADIGSISVSYIDMNGISGMTTTYTKVSTLGLKQWKVYKNVINPDKGEKCRVVFICGNGNLKVKVYNAGGIIIKELFNGKNDGKNNLCETQWDGTNTDGKKVASGVYIINLDTPDYSTNIKTAVIR
jgi:uncharacterized repeat protein (TIGR01451 family)